MITNLEGDMILYLMSLYSTVCAKIKLISAPDSYLQLKGDFIASYHGDESVQTILFYSGIN